MFTVENFVRGLANATHNIVAAIKDNVPLAVSDFTDERRFRRISTRRGGQLFPYKQYKQDLTKYYQQALATNLPFMQYLAFYHVAEFFFQSISEDEAFQVISNFITRPSFSPYRHEDVRNFYNAIKKKIRDQRDDGVWNEKNGLLLCLKRYVPDLSVLKASIDRIDSTAVDYYRTISVAFVDDGKTVNFDEKAEIVYSAIRDRIYATRNAIVHSKHGERLRYVSFRIRYSACATRFPMCLTDVSASDMVFALWSRK